MNYQDTATLLGALATLWAIVWAIAWKFYKQKLERQKDIHKAEITSLNAEHDRTYADMQLKLIKENQEIKKDKPLIQEVKMVYVKYIHIRKQTENPVYQKYIARLNEKINVYSEYNYYRFNKFSSSDNSITLMDKSSGVVELAILHPWKELLFTDLPSRKHYGAITQDVSDSDTYFSASTYYNGFKEGDEDIGMKMEMDTLCARIIADFSSIVGFSNFFIKEPDAYKMELNTNKTKLLGLEKLGEGIYHLEAHNLKKGEALLLDFHVNWDYLSESYK